MKKIYEIVTSNCGTFINRTNKYVAEIEIEGSVENVHVHDPGRLTELLYKDNQVIVNRVDNPKRKTCWDFIAAQKGEKYILVNSMFHNKIAAELIMDNEISPIKNITELRSEVKYNDSRFDFKGKDGNGENIWIEIKGCTLSENGTAMFPDAPTVRGRKHLNELIEIKEKGERAAVVILVFSDAAKFRPKHETDPEFAEVFYNAIEAGVEIYPVLLEYENGDIFYVRELEIIDKE